LPVYNGAAFVDQALASIAGQTTSDYMVLASNNGSTDGTADVLNRWSESIPMEVVTQPQTLPMVAHFNTLLDRIRSEFYMLLCHDDYLFTPDALARALTVMDQHRDVSAVYADLVYVSEGGRPLARRRFGRAGKLYANDLGRRTLWSTRNMFGIPLLVRTSALDAKRYDTHFRYIADVDLSWSISRDAPLWHIPEVLLANRYWSSNSTWSMHGDSHREFVEMAEKHGVPLTPTRRLSMKIMNRYTGVQRRLFHLYERGVTRWG
jgi:glycosyltransferase involved in cell wall biosynthesis